MLSVLLNRTPVLVIHEISRLRFASIYINLDLCHYCCKNSQMNSYVSIWFCIIAEDRNNIPVNSEVVRVFTMLRAIIIYNIIDVIFQIVFIYLFISDISIPHFQAFSDLPNVGTIA